MDRTSDTNFEDNPLLSVTKTDKDRDKELSNLKPKYKGKRKKRETSKDAQKIQPKFPVLPPVSSFLSNDHQMVIPLHQKDSSLYQCSSLFININAKDMIIHGLDDVQDEDQDPSSTLSANQTEKSKASLVKKQKSFEMDKEKIYGHPLFPLLSFLMEKCETATLCIDYVASTDDINQEVQQLARECLDSLKEKFPQDMEVNDLMIRALQVLRIHLLELEKVQELCKDFCSKYLACIQGKMQNDDVLRPENDAYDSDEEIRYLRSDANHSEPSVCRSSIRPFNKMRMKYR